VAELADALDSKSSARKSVWVRLPPSAPLDTKGFAAVAASPFYIAKMLQHSINT
jgi:hypothetical protein